MALLVVDRGHPSSTLDCPALPSQARGLCPIPYFTCPQPWTRWHRYPSLVYSSTVSVTWHISSLFHLES